jgi:predicted dehydrogenase
VKKLKIGIVGVGFAGQFHVECLRKVYGVEVELAGVTSLRPQSYEAFGDSQKINVYNSIEKMLPHIDVLDICSPPYVHEENIIAAAEAGKAVICEKPLTGYFGPEGADENYCGDNDDKQKMLDEVLITLKEISKAVTKNKTFFGYAENYVYAPSVQKEREILEKTGAQILRMTGEESHNGSASDVYGIWRYSGGGSLVGKGVHPLGGMLYLKRIEGLRRNNKPVRPKTVTSKTHKLTRLASYQDKGFIRTNYHDVEDYGFIHITFEDGTVADVLASEVALGGLDGYIEVFANNHRTKCQVSPVHITDTYNPSNSQYDDIYIVEKCSTKEGWSTAAPDEMFTVGYQAQFQDFVECIVKNRNPQSDLKLALDVTAVTYAAYVSDEQKGKEVEVPLL